MALRSIARSDSDKAWLSTKTASSRLTGTAHEHGLAPVPRRSAGRQRRRNCADHANSRDLLQDLPGRECRMQH